MASSSLSGPERMVIPLSGPYQALYDRAHGIQDIEHPSSNLFLNLIIRDLPFIFMFSETPPGSAENRRRLDHKFEIWNNDFGVFYPALLKESKAIGRGKKGVESQIEQGLKHDLKHYKLTHLYGISTIGTSFRVWTAFPGNLISSFDEDVGYLDISSSLGVMIWNDFINAVTNNPPRLDIDEGLSSESDHAMNDAPLSDPQSIPAILNPVPGPSTFQQQELSQQVEVSDAYKVKDTVKFLNDGHRQTMMASKWTHDGHNWSAKSNTLQTLFFCSTIEGMSIPKGKGKGKGK